MLWCPERGPKRPWVWSPVIEFSTLAKETRVLVFFTLGEDRASPAPKEPAAPDHPDI